MVNGVVRTQKGPGYPVPNCYFISCLMRQHSVMLVYIPSFNTPKTGIISQRLCIIMAADSVIWFYQNYREYPRNGTLCSRHGKIASHLVRKKAEINFSFMILSTGRSLYMVTLSVKAPDQSKAASAPEKSDPTCLLRTSVHASFKLCLKPRSKKEKRKLSMNDATFDMLSIEQRSSFRSLNIEYGLPFNREPNVFFCVLFPQFPFPKYLPRLSP